MQTEQLLCWSGVTDTEHITSGFKIQTKKTKFQNAKYNIANCKNIMVKTLFELLHFKFKNDLHKKTTGARLEKKVSDGCC